MNFSPPRICRNSGWATPALHRDKRAASPYDPNPGRTPLIFRGKLFRQPEPALDPAEFIRRFLMHVLPSGFHRIRHYGLFASAVRACNIERIRALLALAEPTPQRQTETEAGADPGEAAHKCPCCGGRMIIIETFEGVRPARPPAPCRIRIDTS